MTAVFLISAALIAFILAGYPLLLAARARLWPAPAIAKEFRPRTVTAIIAVKNGGRWLAHKLDSLLRLDYPRQCLNIIVVSDGSTDDTDEIARRYAEADARIEWMRVPAGGKCAALTAAFPRATGEILFLTDVRQEVAPDSLQHLTANFSDPAVGAVCGEMLIRDPETHDERDIGLYWRFESWIRRTLSRVDSMLGMTGPFYTIRRELAIAIPSQILLDDMYLPLHAFFRGYRLIADPAARSWDYPTSADTEFRRKVRTLAGNYQLLAYYPHLLLPWRNRMWFDYVCYKLGRLLLPHLLIVCALSSWWLPAPWRGLALAAEAAFAALTLLDPVAPRVLKKLTSPPRTFSVMMLAAFYAQSVFFVPPQRLWSAPTQTKSP